MEEGELTMTDKRQPVMNEESPAFRRGSVNRTGTALRLRHLDQVHRLRRRIAELEGQDD